MPTTAAAIAQWPIFRRTDDGPPVDVTVDAGSGNTLVPLIALDHDELPASSSPRGEDDDCPAIGALIADADTSACSVAATSSMVGRSAGCFAIERMIRFDKFWEQWGQLSRTSGTGSITCRPRISRTLWPEYGTFPVTKW